jgi:hypothetical protein
LRAIGRAVIETAPRRHVPSFQDAPKVFTTAFVAVVLPDRAPSPELLELDGERFLPSREKGVGQDYALCTR